MESPGCAEPTPGPGLATLPSDLMRELTFWNKLKADLTGNRPLLIREGNQDLTGLRWNW